MRGNDSTWREQLFQAPIFIKVISSSMDFHPFLFETEH